MTRKFHKRLAVGIVLVIFACVFAGNIQRGNADQDISEETLMKGVHRLSADMVETLDYDGLSVKMVGCVYDPEVTVGVAVFAITGSDEIKYEGYSSFSYNNNVYGLRCTMGSGMTSCAEMKENTLYIYYYFNIYGDKDSDVRLGLYNDSGKDACLLDEFEINDKYTSGKVMHMINNSGVSISSVGMRFEGIYVDDTVRSIQLEYANGDEKEINVYHRSENNGVVTIGFGSEIDINGIKGVIIGDKEYNVINQ
ncbi:hypothetical protein ACTNBM_02880 [Lachnospiraceae bacterium HCP1S3_C3]